MEVQLAARSSERLGEVLWYRNGWRRGKRSADTKWTYFFFIFSLFKCTQREQCSKPLYTNHSDSTFRCCCICSVTPFFLFLSFCSLRLLRESVNIIIIFSYILKIHICKKYAHFWYNHMSLLVNNKIDNCFLSLCHGPLIRFLHHLKVSFCSSNKDSSKVHVLPQLLYLLIHF